MSVKIYDKYSNVRMEANREPDTAHGLTASQIELMNERFSKFIPELTKIGSSDRVQSLFADALPPGASWAATKTAQTTGLNSLPGGGRTLTTQQTPYQPEFSSPDRQQYPVHRILANRYWRLFFKLDPLIGNCVELYSELPWSNFELTGDGIEGEIRSSYEQMCRETQVLALLPYFVREFLVTGEAIPHTFFDNDKGIFTHIAMHNPDQLEVIDAPFIKMDPILEFIPDDRLRSILTSDQPSLRRVRERMPPELLSRLQSRQNIPLSPINTTFIPRKLHPYDTRGTSIISRMWRILMYEDSIFNACHVATSYITLHDGTIKQIGNIEIGDRVLDRTGRTSIVEDKWEEPAPDSICHIKIQGQKRLESTINHKYPVFTLPRECVCGCGTPVDGGSSFVQGHAGGQGSGKFKNHIVWKAYTGAERWDLRLPVDYNPYQTLEAAQIRAGDYLMMPRKFDEVHTDVVPDYARLLGYYIAEGSSPKFSWGRGIKWDMGEHERDTWVTDIVDICARIGPGVSVYPAYSDRKGLQIRMQKKAGLSLADQLRNDGGEYADRKQLSAEVMCWPLALKKELVRGYFRGDGSSQERWNKRSQSHGFIITAASVSQQLINQLRLILAQLGIFAAIDFLPYSQRLQSDGCERKDQWRLSVQGPSLDTLWEILYSEKPPRISDSESPSAVWMDEDFIYIPVESVDVVHNSEPVYNLTVSGDHSYLINHIGTYNSIQAARRASSPLKVAKLGNAATGWIPPVEQEKRLLELLAQAEQDPQAWLVYHYGIQFETIGVSDRIMGINREWDIIERIKLVALGISKSMVHGEVTYASASTGLQVFLQRLKSLRMFFEQKWLYPKFFRPIAEINGWVKPKSNEVMHRYRVKRSARELSEANAYIVPKIVWDKSLDPQINTSLIQAMQALEQLGIKFSKTSKMATVGYSYEEETKKIHREIEFEKTFLPKIDMPPPDQGAGGGGMMGGGEPPPPGAPPEGGEGKAPPGAGGEKPPGVNAPPMPPGPPAPPGAAKVEADDDSSTESVDNTKAQPKSWADGQFNWNVDEVEDIVDLINTSETNSAFWTQLGMKPGFQQAVALHDTNLIWDEIDNYLVDQDYPDRDIKELRVILEQEGVLPRPETITSLQNLERALPDDDTISDDEFVARVQQAISQNGPLNAGSGSFLAGVDTTNTSDLIGDISYIKK